jgi:chromosome segregation ATPase
MSDTRCACSECDSQFPRREPTENDLQQALSEKGKEIDRLKSTNASLLMKAAEHVNKIAELEAKLAAVEKAQEENPCF